MKRLFFITTALISSVVSYADMASRGKPSDLSGDDPSSFDIIIPLLILLLSGAIFVFFWGRDYYLKHKDTIKRIFSVGAIVLFTILVVGLVLGLFVKPNNEESHTETQVNSDNSIINSSSASNNSHPNYKQQIPQPNNISDPWASYPPIIPSSSTPNEAGKSNDFLLAAILNPSFTLYDYYVVLNLTPQNTQFLSYDRYTRSKFVRDRYTPDEFQNIYNSVSRAWIVFNRLQGCDFNSPEIREYMLDYSPFDTSQPQMGDASNPQLIQYLKIKPLYY